MEASAGVEAAVFQPRAELTLQELAAAVRERAAALQEEHLAVELGAAELRQSRLSLPLALYDHGQAMARAARARQHRTEEQRRLTLAAAAARLTGRGQARLVGQQRLVARQQQVLPRVQAILRNVGRAFEARAVPLTDVMRAQRGLGELLREVVSSGGPGEPIGAAPRPAGPSPIRRWKRGR